MGGRGGDYGPELDIGSGQKVVACSWPTGARRPDVDEVALLEAGSGHDKSTARCC